MEICACAAFRCGRARWCDGKRARQSTTMAPMRVAGEMNVCATVHTLVGSSRAQINMYLSLSLSLPVQIRQRCQRRVRWWHDEGMASPLPVSPPPKNAFQIFRARFYHQPLLFSCPVANATCAVIYVASAKHKNPFCLIKIFYIRGDEIITLCSALYIYIFFSFCVFFCLPQPQLLKQAGSGLSRKVVWIFYDGSEHTFFPACSLYHQGIHGEKLCCFFLRYTELEYGTVSLALLTAPF